MSIRDDFFAKQAKGSLWDVAVSIKRGNPLPLDADSIFESYTALEAYAADVLAYPGQIVAVVNADSTGIYYLDQNLAIQPVGIIPSGDSKSIEVTANGMISLLGAKDAANGTLPMIGDDGKLIWKTLEDIGAGDGNDNTTYEITALKKDGETYGIQIQVKENGIASGELIEIPFDVHTTSEIKEQFDAVKTRLETLEGKEDKDTTYSVKAGEKILKLEGTEFSTIASLKYVEAAGTESAKIQLLGIDNAVVSEINATPFIKDGMLHDVDYDPETNKLIFTWNTDEGEKTDEVVLSDIIEPYTAGDGLILEGNTFKVKIDGSSDEYLTVGKSGLNISGIIEAIDNVITNAEADATAKADQALADAKTDAANLYATKGYVGTIPDNYTENNLISYINKKAEETLAAAQGGSSETAASVKQQLDNYKSENNTKVNANTTAITEISDNLSSVNEKLVKIEDNAEVNIIEVIKVNGSALEVTAEDRSVNITVPTTLSQLEGYSSIDERIISAKTQADKGVDDASRANAAAATNAEEINKQAGRLTSLEKTKSDHAASIQELREDVDGHASQYEALKETVNNHAATIAKKADQTALDTISAKVTSNETAIQTINETTIPGLLTEIDKKANSSDVYIKTQIGTISEGMTLVQMIQEKIDNSTYNDTPIRGLLTAETERAMAAEENLSERLSTVETFFAAVETPDETINTLAEIVYYIQGDETGANGMLAAINQNRTDINAINNPGTGILAQAKANTKEQIDAIPIAGALLGLVRSSEEDNKVKVVEEDGTMTVNRISVSKLFVPEGEELILNGGKA